VNNPWKARRVNIEDGWGWWQIYCRDLDRGWDTGIKILMDVNLATQTDDKPDLVQYLLDINNGDSQRNTVEEF